jgi:hypothetical protein
MPPRVYNGVPAGRMLLELLVLPIERRWTNGPSARSFAVGQWTTTSHVRQRGVLTSSALSRLWLAFLVSL